MIPWYGISNLLIGITSLGISLFVFLKGPKTKTNRIWTILTISIAIYGFGAYMVSLSKDVQSAFFWWQAAYLGIIMIPVLFMHFVCSFLDIKRPLLLKIIYSIGFVLLILNIFRRDLFMGNVSLFFADSRIFKSGYWAYPPSPILVFFIIFFFMGLALWSHIELIRGYKRADFIKRYQIKYFLLGTVSGFIGGGTSFLPCLNIHLYPVLNILVVIYPLVTSYAIIKYRLMDVSITITRTGIFIAVYTFVLGLPFVLVALGKDWLVSVLGLNWWIGPLVLMAALATGGPFVYIYFQKRAEAILLRVQRNYQEILKQTAMGMTRIRSPKKLLNLIVDSITDTVHISHSAIYLFDTKTEQFVLKAGRNLKSDQPELIDKKNTLVTWLMSQRAPLVYEEIKRKCEDEANPVFKDLEQQLRFLNATVVVASFLEDKMLDIIMLGDKELGKIYTSEDLNIFSVLASQAALAIENALLYENIEEEVRQRGKQLVEVQKQLVQAEKLATVGTLAGGVAHEINNPLTAILTNAQMLLADKKSFSQDSKESLELIEEATQRCRTIVQKLMAYAKKPLESAGVSEVDLLNVGRKAISFLSYQFEHENIKIITKAKEDSYLVNGNQNELEQVFTNILLNARDAIIKIKKSGTINITILKTDDWVKAEIKDDGIGIPNNIVNKIFDPFFTTKEVGKGLGLGLSICQAIIEKHNGLISVSSELNKGSVFTVQLPKAKQAAKV